MKGSFILYQEMQEVFEALTDEQAGRLIKTVFEYCNIQDKKRLKIDDDLKLVFIPIRQQLDRNEQKYEEKSEKRRLAGSKGGKQKVANLANATFATKNLANVADNDNVNDNVNDNDNVNNTPPISPQGDKADVINLSSDFLTYGEYNNVYLTPLMRNEIDTFVMDKKAASELIEDLSLNIVRNKAPVFDASNPKMHLAELKAYWNYRRKHNNKPTETEQDEAIAIFCGKKKAINDG